MYISLLTRNQPLYKRYVPESKSQKFTPKSYYNLSTPKTSSELMNALRILADTPSNTMTKEVHSLIEPAPPLDESIHVVYNSIHMDDSRYNKGDETSIDNDSEEPKETEPVHEDVTETMDNDNKLKLDISKLAIISSNNCYLDNIDLDTVLNYLEQFSHQYQERSDEVVHIIKSRFKEYPKEGPITHYPITFDAIIISSQLAQRILEEVKYYDELDLENFIYLIWVIMNDLHIPIVYTPRFEDAIEYKVSVNKKNPLPSCKFLFQKNINNQPIPMVFLFLVFVYLISFCISGWPVVNSIFYFLSGIVYWCLYDIFVSNLK